MSAWSVGIFWLKTSQHTVFLMQGCQSVGKVASHGTICHPKISVSCQERPWIFCEWVSPGMDHEAHHKQYDGEPGNEGRQYVCHCVGCNNNR